MSIRVSKFGGTSLADSVQVRKALDILRADESRRFVVPSAPGKRHDGDDKITDLLISCHRMAMAGEDPTGLLAHIRGRFDNIIRELGLDIDLGGEFDRIARDLAKGASRDYVASRGEYLTGRLLACALGWEFIDPAGVILFDDRGRFDPEVTHERLSERLRRAGRAVIPGFYGSCPDGSIKTFSRGGSDITGAIVARAAGADVYENWTDVPGFMMADPRIVPDARVIDVVSYRELRELSYMGAQVLHEESVFPVRQAGIPIQIRDTNHPDAQGTLIVNEAPHCSERIITGVAGRRGFSVVHIEKELMNSELGFGRRVLSVMERHGISFEHMPTGIDTLSVIVSDDALNGHLDEVLADIRECVDPDRVEVTRNLALVATVGQGMVRHPGTAARLFSGLASAGVNVRMIDQGSSEMNIIVGVDESDFEKAVRAIYAAFQTGKRSYP